MQVLHIAVLSLYTLIHVAVCEPYCRPSQSCWPSSAELQTFKLQMNSTAARVMLPGDSDWVSKYLTYNQAVAQVPGIIVFVGNVDHIREALKFAYKYRIEVRLQSTGHSFFGRCGGEGVMQISVHYMRSIEVDMNCTEHDMGCITTQSGVRWADAYKEADKHNRVVVGGSDPSVSVSGWTLGGGHSPLSRSHGLGVDNVLSFHLITADLSEVWTSAAGTTVKFINGSVTRTSDAQLFWGLRGGGSVFGVLVDLTFKLHKDDIVSQMYCTYYAFTDGSDKTFNVILKTLGNVMVDAPNSFSGYLLPSVGCSAAGCGGTMAFSLLRFGNASSDERWVESFTSLPKIWAQHGVTQGGCTMKQYSSYYDYQVTVPNTTYATVYIGNSLIGENKYTNATIDVMLHHLNQVYNLTKTDKRANIIGTATWVGGAVNAGKDDSAVNKGWRSSMFSFTSAFAWDPKTTSDPSPFIKLVKDLHVDLKPYSNGKYYNEAETDMTPQQWKSEFWGDRGDKYNKILNIKQRWDPSNKFTCHQCVGSDAGTINDLIG